jgi:predicted MFS family arabinose efflux permease
MTAVFAGGALSSAVTGVILAHGDWTDVALFAALLTAAAAIAWLAEHRPRTA